MTEIICCNCGQDPPCKTTEETPTGPIWNVCCGCGGWPHDDEDEQ